MERTPVSFGPGVFLIYGGSMAEKIFKTLDDLVDLLKERGVDIPDASSRDYAKEYWKNMVITIL